MGCAALCIALLSLLARSTFAQSCTLITSNVLRADSEETFIVDGHGTALDGDIIIQDFPKKEFTIVQGKISVNSSNGFLGTRKFMVPSTNLHKDPKKKEFVYVILRSGHCDLEKVVLISYQSGYIFIQTDKPLYTPGSKVLYRIYSLTPDLKPISKSVITDVLTPENILVKNAVKQTGLNGILSDSYEITDLASLGTWTLMIKFEDTPIHNFTTHFDVKEYVLPSFEVKIIPDKTFFHISDKEFTVEIKAKYLYGRPMDGVAYVLFSLTREGERKGLADTLQRIEIDHGEGSAVLKREVLVKYFQKETDMLQWTLSVSATVITDSGSDMVETELNDIPIVTSPYKVHYIKTSMFFKPGMPMVVTVLVTNPDGSPAHRVPVVAEPGTVRGTTQEDGIIQLTINTNANISSFEIKVTTADPQLPPTQQASSAMKATAYRPRGGNFLHLSFNGGKLNIGVNAAINFIIRNTDPGVQNQITHFNYIILNKGRIVTTGRQERSQGQPVVTLQLLITPELVPSFRIVAYYVVSTEAGREIVADSISIDVENTCMGTLSLSYENAEDNKVYSPGNSVRLKLNADHKASVGLVAVDKGVYVLNSKEKISQSKVWDSVKKYDTGCTVGGGEDAAGVFYDAGLALTNAFHGSTPQKSESLCEVKLKRRRRDTAALIQTKNTKASNYEGLEKTCCVDGMRDLPMKVSCESRAKNIVDGEKCVNAFLDCCKHIEKIKEAEDIDEELARSNVDDDFIDDADIISRSSFPESFLWNVVTMTEEPKNGFSSKIVSVNLKDSLTTWEVLAVGLSEKGGICVSKPHNIQVALSFFIDLRLPYSVVKNEQVEIRAILYNYDKSQHRVRVEWSYNEHFCSLSTSKKKYRQILDLKPESSIAIPFIIIPLTTGYHDIEVKASGQRISDGVKKKLRVVAQGKLTVKTLANVILDPERKGRSGEQEEIISTVDMKNIVPGTDVKTIVTVQGTSISQLVEQSIDGANVNHLITAPFGCGEQNMMRMTPTVIATHYLDATGQWQRVGVQRRAEALQHMNTGLTTQLTFRREDGSYGAWDGKPSSTWLTAYVVKVFAIAQTLININKNLLCDPVKWLVLKQNPDGLFEERAPVYQQEMVGGITTGAVELHSTLTAFVLIAILEGQKSCNEDINNLQHSIDKAIAYIEKQYPVINKPYSIAITSYALARAGKLQNINKLMSASTDDNHWEEPNSRDLSLEASSYALLALLKMKEYEKAGPVVRWLTEQRFHGMVWGSTQSTIMLFQSIAEYYIDTPNLKELEMEVSFKLPGRTGQTRLHLNNGNALNTRTDQTEHSGNFVVTATGKGQGTLSVFSAYYAIETEKESQCNNFNLSLQVQEEPLAKGPEGTESSVSLTICTRYLKSQDSGMAILQISMMTGFEVDVNDLMKLKRGVDRYISNFEINKGASNKSTVVLYVDKISHSEEQCLKFHLHQYFKMGLIQPASVTVYDYYSPENRCTKFYHVNEESKLLSKICVKEMCHCAEANCFMQQRLDNVDDVARFYRACTHGVDYVYKTTLSEIQEENSFLIYVMNITHIIKKGTDEVTAYEKRSFMSHAKCRTALNLEVGKDYMAWGVSKDMWKPSNQFIYMVTRDTWVERWPNSRECQKRQYSKLCDQLFNFSQELEAHGCPR